MRSGKRIALWLGLVALGAAVFVTSGTAQSNTAYSIELSGTIDPASEDFVVGELGDATDQSAALVIVTLDTAGGLADSAEDIVVSIQSAPMPVVVYVSPGDAKAEGAGLEVAEAADLVAIAPDATLVTDDGELSAEAALEAGLVDVIASSEDALLAELDGRAIGGSKAQTLDTGSLTISDHEMSALDELKQIVINPNVAYLLLLLGLAGIGIELLSPGLFFPGTVGIISLLLGIYGSAQLPVTLIGVLLLIAGVALMIAEVYLPTGGILGIAGIASLIGSGLLLYDTGTDALEVEVPVIVAVAVVLGGLGLLMGERVLRAQRQKRVLTGWEELSGAEGDVRVALRPLGQIFVEGALWRARPEEDEDEIPVGERVRVKRVDGLTLIVERVESEAEPESVPTEGA